MPLLTTPGSTVSGALVKLKQILAKSTCMKALDTTDQLFLIRRAALTNALIAVALIATLLPAIPTLLAMLVVMGMVYAGVFYPRSREVNTKLRDAGLNRKEAIPLVREASRPVSVVMLAAVVLGVLALLGANRWYSVELSQLYALLFLIAVALLFGSSLYLWLRAKALS